MKLLSLLVLSLVLVSCAGIREEINYDVGEQVHKGYYAGPRGPGKRPGIIVVHEWWGHNDYVRKRAEQLSKLGYHAFALDMYGNGKNTTHPKDAGAFSKEAMKNPKLLIQKFKKAMEVLKSKEGVDPDRIGAIGYCFGGAVVLNAARAGLDLDGVVSFHGSLKSPLKAKKGKVKAKLLVLNGAEDPMITKKDIKNFKNEMRRAQVSYEFINYPGALHAFTNPAATEIGEKFDIPVAYDEAADKDSWKMMKDFFELTLR